MITSFQAKKVAEYLRPGQRVLIRFGHGLGDTIMFVPSLDRLRQLYPETQIELYVENGQEAIWPSVKDKDAAGYDHVFSLDFPMSEGSGLTKAEKCCREELGIPPVEGVANLPRCQSPLVALHFQGTALPDSVNCPEDLAAQIWREVVDAGLVPIEVHFEHTFHNPRNARHPCVTNSVRGSRATLPNLFGLLQRCRAFVGVASGPFVAALSIMPMRTMLLERAHKATDYTRLPIATADVRNYLPGKVRAWLAALS